jgi:hypothetical protein
LNKFKGNYSIAFLESIRLEAAGSQFKVLKIIHAQTKVRVPIDLFGETSRKTSRKTLPSNKKKALQEKSMLVHRIKYFASLLQLIS